LNEFQKNNKFFDKIEFNYYKILNENFLPTLYLVPIHNKFDLNDIFTINLTKDISKTLILFYKFSSFCNQNNDFFLFSHDILSKSFNLNENILKDFFSKFNDSNFDLVFLNFLKSIQ
jgi:hypothetical protein